MTESFSNQTTKTVCFRNPFQKVTKWKWTEVDCSAFAKFKKEVIGKNPLKYFDQNAVNMLTRDPSSHEMVATLWQVDGDERRLVASASNYLAESEKNYAEKELKVLVEVHGL